LYAVDALICRCGDLRGLLWKRGAKVNVFGWMESGAFCLGDKQQMNATEKEDVVRIRFFSRYNLG